MGKHLDKDVLRRLDRGELGRADLDRLLDEVVEHLRELPSQELVERRGHTAGCGDSPDPAA